MKLIRRCRHQFQALADVKVPTGKSYTVYLCGLCERIETKLKENA